MQAGLHHQRAWSITIRRFVETIFGSDQTQPALGNPAGDGRYFPYRHVHRRDSNGDLALLHRQAPGTQHLADQVFITRHYRFGLIAPTISGRLLPSHAATLGHKLDVAVTRTLGVAVVLV